MNEFEKLKERTRAFAVKVVKTVNTLPHGRSNDILGKQVLRSATSIGANYRAASRARSKPEFVAKMHIVQEEADETQYWLELLHDSGSLGETEYRIMHSEAKELTAIFTASEKTARLRMAEHQH